jgi:hypothetical protein
MPPTAPIHDSAIGQALSDEDELSEELELLSELDELSLLLEELSLLLEELSLLLEELSEDEELSLLSEELSEEEEEALSLAELLSELDDELSATLASSARGPATATDSGVVPTMLTKKMLSVGSYDPQKYSC